MSHPTHFIHTIVAGMLIVSFFATPLHLTFADETNPEASTGTSDTGASETPTDSDPSPSEPDADDTSEEQTDSSDPETGTEITETNNPAETEDDMTVPDDETPETELTPESESADQPLTLTATDSEATGSDTSTTSETMLPTATSSDDATGSDGSGNNRDSEEVNALSSSTPALDLPVIEVGGSVTAATTTIITDSLDTPTYPAGTTTIETGDAVATANIVNIVNSNFVNSDGSIVVWDILSGSFTTLDLRTASGTCSLSNCTTEGFTVNVSNDADIENILVLSANTGSNTIAHAETGVIETGDAYANANLINVANLNLVNSNYLLAIINAFSSVAGDIVFPSLTAYMTSESTPSAINLSNTGTIGNDITANADTGSNAVYDANGMIVTGVAETAVSLINQLNSSLIGGENVSLLLRVHGDWTGEVYGLPDGIEMIGINGGYLLNFNRDHAAISTDGAINATNTASISNKLLLDAMTGNNTIYDADTALITTGNAYVGANVINVANANVIGRNWMLGIINIFGDFTGNLSFGRPDLWIGGSVAVPSRTFNGDTVTYEYTVTNRGDSYVNNVVLTDKLSPFVSPADSALTGYDANSHTIKHTLGRLDPGETVTFSYSATVANASYQTDITNTAMVAGRETDNDVKDNVEVVTFRTKSNSSSGGSSSNDDDNDNVTNRDNQNHALLSASGGITDQLKITRTPRVATMRPGETVTETLVLYNTSNQPIEQVVVIDTLYQAGTRTIISKESWDLGTIAPHEEITLSYDLSFNAAAAGGEYYFETEAQNHRGQLSVFYNGQLFLIHPVTTSLPELLTPYTTNPNGLVLGSATTSSLGVMRVESVDLPSLFPLAEAAEVESTDTAPNAWRPYLELLLLTLFVYVADQLWRHRQRLFPRS